jgi:uncharacterized membrane protein YedE/YeeE
VRGIWGLALRFRYAHRDEQRRTARQCLARDRVRRIDAPPDRLWRRQREAGAYAGNQWQCRGHRRHHHVIRVASSVRDFDGFAPFDFASLLTVPGFVCVVVGGFLVGFGARYAGGCTSGHAITGLACLEPPSLIAVMGFFAGGLASTHLLLPVIFAS